MKKVILVGIALGALLALAAPVHAEDGDYPVCPILPSSDQAMDSQAGFDVNDDGEHYLDTGVDVSVPLQATNLNGEGMLYGPHASPPWREEGYTPIWARWGE